MGKEIGKRGAKLEKSDVTEADITLSGGANKRVVAICLTVVMAAVVGVSLFIYRTDFPTSQRIAAEAAPGVEETVPEADNERTADAGIITFGSGSKAFNMEFVAIGNPGNAADTPSDPNPAAGKVDYPYQMGKFEVSEDMITKSNASQSLQITKDTRGVDKPATSVSWN